MILAPLTIPHSSIRPGIRLRALLVACGALTIGLAGCQSDQDQRLSEARELLRQKQIAAAAAPATPPPTALQPAAPAPAPPGASAGALGMPLYPGSIAAKSSPSPDAGSGDGLAMALLETHDSVDAVIAFYEKQLETPGARIPPTRTEDTKNGRRTICISVPRADGGLQTVEAAAEDGKTTIQLMNLEPASRAAAPAIIPGVNPRAAPRR